MTLFFG